MANDKGSSDKNGNNKFRDEQSDEETAAGGLFMGDALKKLFTAGVSAAFMTEESIRSFVGELKLPKETINVVLAGAAKSKEQLMDRVGREIVGIISKIDFVKEASRFVEEHKFKISAEIEVLRKEPSSSDRPSVETKLQVQTEAKDKV